MNIYIPVNTIKNDKIHEDIKSLRGWTMPIIDERGRSSTPTTSVIFES